MNNPVQTQPSTPSQPPKIVQSGSLEIIKWLPVVLIILLMLVFWLNYFGLVTLSNSIPSLSFLPTISRPSQTITKNNKTLSFKLMCPAPGQFCTSSKDVTKDNQYVGFGGKVTAGTKVIAAFDGELLPTTTTLPEQFKAESFQSLYLVNRDNKILARYIFKGDVTRNGKVREGDTIATIKSTIAYYDGNALIFTFARNFQAPSASDYKFPIVTGWFKVKSSDFK